MIFMKVGGKIALVQFVGKVMSYIGQGVVEILP